MAYTFRRPTGGYGVQIYETPSRETFVCVVEEYGQTLEITRINKGEWNEGREFRVGGHLVEFAFKGARPDWAAMEREVRRLFGPKASA